MTSSRSVGTARRRPSSPRSMRLWTTRTPVTRPSSPCPGFSPAEPRKRSARGGRAAGVVGTLGRPLRVVAQQVHVALGGRLALGLEPLTADLVELDLGR